MHGNATTCMVKSKLDKWTHVHAIEWRWSHYIRSYRVSKPVCMRQHSSCSCEITLAVKFTRHLKDTMHLQLHAWLHYMCLLFEALYNYIYSNDWRKKWLFICVRDLVIILLFELNFSSLWFCHVILELFAKQSNSLLSMQAIKQAIKPLCICFV